MANPCFQGQVRPVARTDEINESKNFTIPNLRPAGNDPQHFVVGQALFLLTMEDELHNRRVFLFWLLFGSNALDLKKTRCPLQWTILRRRGQLEDIDCPILRCLTAKIASSLLKVIRNSNFKKGSIWKSRRLNLMTDSSAEDRSLCMIYECFPVTDDRFIITSKDDDVQEFDTRWDEVTLSIRTVPSEACIRCASVSLISSKPYWHCTNKILNNTIHN